MTPFIATVLLVLTTTGEAVAAEGWRRPLPHGAVVRTFAYDRATPFAGGARRGIDVAAAPGARVGAVCAGVVVWAGRVPRWDRGVTLRCSDGLVATELGLRSIAVHRGAAVLPGTPLGRLRPRGPLRVGARHATDRLGWIDPEPLFAAGDDARPTPPLPAILRRGDTPRLAPRAPRLPLRPASHAVPRRPTASAPSTAAPSPLPPVPVLLGLALLAAAATAAPVARRRRPRRSIAEIAVAQR